MARLSGVTSEGLVSNGSGGYTQRSAKRPRFNEPNPYFPVLGIPVPTPGLVEAYSMPGTTSGSKWVRTFDPNSYLMGPTFYGPSHASSIPSVESTSCTCDFPVVRIRGLPFNCKGPDIYSFFMGLDVVDCLFVNKNGQFTGEAYVVFSSPMQVHLALQRDHQNMGHRYVEIFACKKSDYYNAVATEVNFAGCLSAHKRSPSLEPQNKWTRKEPREDKKSLDAMHFTEVLRLRGLPYSVTKKDIVEFFGQEFDLKEADIDICCRVNGKATGEAFAKFSSAEMAKKAMNRDKMSIGSRYVELFPSTPKERCRASSKCA
ncbi:heterogeneous nuclear ribonucleoprotein F-like isoform X2 [Carex littledalei]|uniref:Heterogeneous nuclear ribonucleoprotein F-like isoform X2 n=1 Tax=Carex littledalei TaxID=544730 RepID=A0A833RLM0_9POAL|nr:heterogeneous nuclear ribonucleoprotein F-like isoform X2 [Carex littledalei]